MCLLCHFAPAVGTGEGSLLAAQEGTADDPAVCFDQLQQIWIHQTHHAALLSSRACDCLARSQLKRNASAAEAETAEAQTVFWLLSVSACFLEALAMGKHAAQCLHLTMLP